MVSIGAMYTMGSGFTVDHPHPGRNYREHVDRCERFDEGNIAVNKREIKAEGREFLKRPQTTSSELHGLAIRQAQTHQGKERLRCGTCNYCADWYSPNL